MKVLPNGRCEVRVQRAPGSAHYLSRTFEDVARADAWRKASLARLDAGFEPSDADLAASSAPTRGHLQPPTGAAVLAPMPTVAEVCRQFADWHYHRGRGAQPEREQSVRRDIERHIAPFFDAHTVDVTDLEPSRHLRTGGTPAIDLVKGFQLNLVGLGEVDAADAEDDLAGITGKADGRYITLSEAIELTGSSESTIKRRRAAGKLPGSWVEEPPAGRLLIPVRDLRAAGLLAGSTSSKPLMQSTATDVIWILTQGVERAVGLGLLSHNVVRGMGGAKPAESRKRKQAPPWTLTQCRNTARHLNPVYQLIVWLKRILGLRMSEVYGMHVGDVVEDDGYGICELERQGGRPFLLRNRDGSCRRVGEKDALKNEASRRVVILCPLLMQLVNLIIRVYHTDPDTGEVDYQAPLIPNFNGADYRQQAFSVAYKRALSAAGLTDDGQVSPVPHDLRKAAATMLKGEGIDDMLRRRMLGHTAGDDVHDRIYVLDDPLLYGHRLAAQAIEELIGEEVDTLIVPTIKRPLIRHASPYKDREAYMESELERAYAAAQPDDTDRLCGVARVAHELGIAETTARRWLREGRLPTQTSVGAHGIESRLVRLSALRACRATLQSSPTLADFAEEFGLDYHHILRVTQLLRLELAPHPSHRSHYVVSESHTHRIQVELARISALHERAATVSEAAELLRCARRTVDATILRRDLEQDDESDGSDSMASTTSRRQAM